MWTTFSFRAARTCKRTPDDARQSWQLVFALINQFVFSDPSALVGVKKVVPVDDF
jgi:hypothetical protein